MFLPMIHVQMPKNRFSHDASQSLIYIVQGLLRTNAYDIEAFFRIYKIEMARCR